MSNAVIGYLYIQPDPSVYISDLELADDTAIIHQFPAIM